MQGWLHVHLKKLPGPPCPFKQEEELNEATDKMADATPEEHKEHLEKMVKSGTILMMAAFYSLDIKIEKAARVASLWKWSFKVILGIGKIRSFAGNYVIP
ncbi:hypothetical protein [Cytobacillus sp. BC1816]|uniref:hypothetical protein n=1 Tax=Cytobacillus sp. BC1816 TaxID=3440154 RepID=UPI003F510355